MTVKDAINGLRVLLGQDNVVKNVKFGDDKDRGGLKKESFDSVDLVDGTVVYTDGAIEVGKTLFVETGSEENPFAPEGLHETSAGQIITVGPNGEIMAIEEVVAEAPAVADAPAADVAMEEVVVEEAPVAQVEESFNAEELLAAIAEMIKSYTDQVSQVTEELSSLKERFNEIADAPAADAIKKQSFMEEAKAARVAADARLERLAKMRKQFS